MRLICLICLVYVISRTNDPNVRNIKIYKTEINIQYIIIIIKGWINKEAKAAQFDRSNANYVSVDSNMTHRYISMLVRCTQKYCSIGDNDDCKRDFFHKIRQMDHPKLEKNRFEFRLLNEMLDNKRILYITVHCSIHCSIQ